MNVVLVCLNNFQPYILTNIKQLLSLQHSNIFVITNSYLFSRFDEYKTQITLIEADLLHDSFEFEQKTTLNKHFKNGFWWLTSLRFFYIYEFMKRYNMTNIVHLENDVLIYHNCNSLINLVDSNFLYMPFDTYKRNIASIMYIPNKEVFKTILDNYDFNKNDMDNFSSIKQTTGLIKQFPIFIANQQMTDEEKFVCENSASFPYIFDAAAIGQYVGGVDPNNIPGNTVGFVNETCVIKYNNYKIWFEMNDYGNKKPFIMINDKPIPIFNLHIHSKGLENFI